MRLIRWTVVDISEKYIMNGRRIRWVVLTTAGQMLVIAIFFRSWRMKSIARPLVRTLMATFPIERDSNQFRERLYQAILTRPTHGIRRLPAKEPRINRRRDNNNPTFPAILLKSRQSSLDTCIQTLGVNPLHQLEALGGRILNRRPPDSPRVVHKDVEFPVDADCLFHQILDLGDVADVHRDGGSLAAGFADLASDGVDGGLGGVGIRWEGGGFLCIGGCFGSNDDWAELARVVLLNSG